MNAAVSAGATGVIVPHVDTADDAARAVDAAGGRVALVVQAESQEAVHVIDDIVQVAGVDAVLVGPYDLSRSLGLSGQVEHPTVREAIAVVAAACRRASMPIGIFGTTAQAVQPYAAAGFTLLVAGVDAGLLRAAAASLLQELRG
jgi:2-keto-3-deoxy-L-rhamnonate aldolase RhmA